MSRGRVFRAPVPKDADHLGDGGPKSSPDSFKNFVEAIRREQAIAPLVELLDVSALQPFYPL